MRCVFRYSGCMKDGSDLVQRALREEAEVALLDRRYFALPLDAFNRFRAILDNPPTDNQKLRRLLETKAPWD
jgi:uncharacterized protein (DUF1778 family)